MLRGIPGCLACEIFNFVFYVVCYVVICYRWRNSQLLVLVLERQVVVAQEMAPGEKVM